MPWYRAGNPDCPKTRELGYARHPSEMLRAYIRDPGKRVFVGVGWYCQYCLCFMSDKEAERLRQEEKSRVY